MKEQNKYRKFDPVDYLRSETAFEEYIAALREEGANEDEIEDAYRDIERARMVHNIPALEPAMA